REDGIGLASNPIGLANPGIEAALTHLAPEWARWNTTVLLSLSADSVTQFAEMTAMTAGVAGFQAIELNLSCPNLEVGDLFSHSATATAAVTTAVKANTNLPVLVKLSPNVPNITEIALAAVDSGADALTISNTLPAMSIDVDTRQPVLGAITGGLSGPGLRAVSLALVYKAAQVVDVPIIGVGGIFSARDALEFILARATAVQIGSANLADLWAPFKILEELRDYLAAQGIDSIQELIGSAQVKATV
ncbi:MAG: dihydroorotate dehydrogenase, partial [Dehalococcoidia bacterium]